MILESEENEMIKVGDLVKVKSKTKFLDTEKEFIPIGTICKVTETDTVEGELIICIVPIDRSFCGYWYLPEEVTKGHLEWVEDE